jgi:hypothetical protein
MVFMQRSIINQSSFKRKWVLFWLGLTSFIYVAHGFFLSKNLIDAPWGDEWEYFAPYYQDQLYSLKWFFSFHNEHRIVFSKIVFSLFDHFGALNFKWMAMFSYGLYGFLLVVVYRAGLIIGVQKIVLAPFMVFFVSSASLDNFYWAFQNCFRWVFLFFFCALVVFDPRRFTRSLLTLALLLFSIFSLSNGVTLAFGFAVALIGYLLLKNRNSLGAASVKNIISEERNSLVLLLGLLAGVLLWIVGYPEASSESVPYTWPTQWRFWQHYFGTFSWLFGIQKVNDGITLLAVVVLLFVSRVFIDTLLKKNKTTESTKSTGSAELTDAFDLSSFKALSWALGIAFSVAVISLGRASYGGGQGKANRYAEIIVMFVPVVLWAIQKVKRDRGRRSAFWGLWLLCLLGYAKHFRFDVKYREMAQTRLEDRECVLTHPKVDCPRSYPPGPIPERLDIARKMGAHFVRE